MKNSIRVSLFGVALCLSAMALPSFADDMSANQAATYKEVESMFGKVPEFVKKFPKAGIVGAWQEEKDLELSDKTALPPKTKALISLAVAAQIPCQYCIYADTQTARQLGATDEEIAEAVGMAALTRHWSTVFNGLQIDFEQFKKDMGGQ
jgi:AhpD family alkylhydroperoxidase